MFVFLVLLFNDMIAVNIANYICRNEEWYELEGSEFERKRAPVVTPCTWLVWSIEVLLLATWSYYRAFVKATRGKRTASASADPPISSRAVQIVPATEYNPSVLQRLKHDSKDWRRRLDHKLIKMQPARDLTDFVVELEELEERCAKCERAAWGIDIKLDDSHDWYEVDLLKCWYMSDNHARRYAGCWPPGYKDGQIDKEAVKKRADAKRRMGKRIILHK
ncbi:uncharacterized protein KY384_002860 [Bacidia gigantensis]|uniref:uncharacterized protein n=1 Tax=Bacidia gigantensis TaxID=2732470 RepID=UPI001D03C2E5|nr:uncharacterized protein KY384_002860 [Bacidia gigantensis]KAG8532375.1 hypothetical protein KY384_002860 [Bacidia gigantensis]